MPEEGDEKCYTVTPLPTICKDFQSKFCARVKCKFLHLTTTEEIEYISTGRLPSHGGKPEISASGGTIVDICKDFINGKCMRGAGCKFMHPFNAEQLGKRPCLDYINNDTLNDGSDNELITENEKLLVEIKEVQKQLDSLRQTNDTLFEQNTRYRAQIKGEIPPDIPTTASTSTSIPSLLKSSISTKPPSLLTINETTNSTTSASYAQNYQTQYQQYAQAAYSQYYSQYSQMAQYSQYTNPYNQSYQQQYQQYLQQQQQQAYVAASTTASIASDATTAAAAATTAVQYSQLPTYQSYYQPGYDASQYWSTYPTYG